MGELRVQLTGGQAVPTGMALGRGSSRAWEWEPPWAAVAETGPEERKASKQGCKDNPIHTAANATEPILSHREDCCRIGPYG